MNIIKCHKMSFEHRNQVVSSINDVVHSNIANIIYEYAQSWFTKCNICNHVKHCLVKHIKTGIRIDWYAPYEYIVILPTDKADILNIHLVDEHPEDCETTNETFDIHIDTLTHNLAHGHLMSNASVDLNHPYELSDRSSYKLVSILKYINVNVAKTKKTDELTHKMSKDSSATYDHVAKCLYYNVIRLD